MTLLQLAVASDDEEVFYAVASFAAEHGLPRGAVAAWKSEVDKSDVDDATKAKREK